jgi:hypothetical protein
MKGTIVSPLEVQARWSWAEIAGRHAARYRAVHPEPDDLALQDQIVAGTSFDSLPGRDKARLAHWFQTGYRSDYANAFGWYQSFICQAWTKDQLLQLCALPRLDPQRRWQLVPLLSFLLSPADPNDPDDPRVAAQRVPLDQPFTQTEPLVLGHWDDGTEVLWEGYFRAALFLRSEDRDAQVLVWVPHRGHWPVKQGQAEPQGTGR